MRFVLTRIAATIFVALFSAACLGQSASRPIRLIVPIPPGGAPDISARVIGQRLSEIIAQPVVVENRPGSNGNIVEAYITTAAEFASVIRADCEKYGKLVKDLGVKVE